MRKVEVTPSLNIPQKNTTFKISQYPAIFFSPKDAEKAEREQQVLKNLKAWSQDVQEITEDSAKNEGMSTPNPFSL